MRAVLASMLLLALIAGAVAGCIAWYIDFTHQLTGNRGFNGVLAITSAGGTVVGIGVMALLRVDSASLLLAALRGPDRRPISALGPLGWTALAVVGVSLYCLVFALTYGLLVYITLRTSHA